MTYLITPSKLVGETFTLTFSFLDRLEWGEELSSAACTVEVVSGIDSDPEEVLLSTSTVSSDGTYVTQQVYQGLPGVIYKIVCGALSDASHTYIKISYLAVLPDDEVAPFLPFVGQIETVEMSSGA